MNARAPLVTLLPVLLALTGISLATVAFADSGTACKGNVYLTIDTGHMEPAEKMVAILRKYDVKATFFLANEKTKHGETALNPAWTSFWKARADEGHAFGSHTWRHWYFRGDIGADKVSYIPWGTNKAGISSVNSVGNNAGNNAEALNAQQVCEELKRSEIAFKSMTGRGFDKIWRAPGGKLTPNTIRFAEACGYKHVPWSPAGFSGDELSSEKFPAEKLISAQLRDIKDGDILLWHLGIWSRKEPLYPKLDELIAGLKAKGMCFAKITDHPNWKN